MGKPVDRQSYERLDRRTGELDRNRVRIVRRRPTLYATPILDRKTKSFRVASVEEARIAWVKARKIGRLTPDQCAGLKVVEAVTKRIVAVVHFDGRVQKT